MTVPQTTPSATRLTLVAAVAHGGVVGANGAMPWHLPQDLAHFRRLTQGHPVLMGRRTWESLPPQFRPLPGRRNLVLTRNAAWQDRGAQAVTSVAAALNAVADAPELFVIGGASVWAEALPLAQRLVLTELDLQVDGDTHFPPWDRAAFRRTAHEAHRAGAPNDFAFAFATYERRAGVAAP